MVSSDEEINDEPVLAKTTMTGGTALMTLVEGEQNEGPTSQNEGSPSRTQVEEAQPHSAGVNVPSSSAHTN